MKIKHELLREGVAKVKDMGFRMVNVENIYYDEVYSAYFQNLLLQKRGISKYLDEIIDEIIKEIETKTNVR